MKLLSVNVSLPKDVRFKGRAIRTGIFKAPVEGRVLVRTLNLDGDGQADLVGHGGEFRAVLVYSYDNYAYWARELERSDFAFGQFGENFTVEGMLDDEVHVGDRFRIGTGLFEVTQPRVPCYKLAMKMQSEGFYNRLLESGRPGFYFRVLEEGEVGAGDPIERVSTEPTRMTVRRISNLLYFEKDDLDDARRASAIPALSHGWKQSFERRLSKASPSKRGREHYRTLRVTRKVTESETIKSFYLEPADDLPLPSFSPGQFLPLKLDIPGQYQPVFRTYSLSDSPSAKHYRLTVKKEPAPPNRPDLYPGVSSNFLHDQVDVGSTLLAKSPRGTFFLHPGDTPVVLLSAGVGQTPLVSMLEWTAENETNRPTWFIHGARNGREHAMGDHIRRTARENENVHAHTRYSQPAAADTVGRHYDDQGRVDIDLVRRLAPGQDCEFYVCGPSPFMKSLFEGLIEWGVPEVRIHYEFFGPAALLGDRSKVATPARRAEATQCCGDVEVAFTKSSVKTNWNDSYGSLLELAEANGLSPDYSCRSGVCRTCESRLESGEVEYVIEPLDPPEDDAVLICCARPKTNVRIAV